MRILNTEQLAGRLASLPENPRVVASGNFATPQSLLKVIDTHVDAYRLNILNAQGHLPSRSGVIHETSFVGPGCASRRPWNMCPVGSAWCPSCGFDDCPRMWCCCTPHRRRDRQSASDWR